VKSILVHIQNDESVDERLETALSLARACDAHLSCVHITPIEAYVAFDSFGGIFVMNDVIKTLDEEERQLREKIENELRTEDVSWDYTQMTGSVPWQIIRQSALADLLVTGREPHFSDFEGPAVRLLGELLHHSRTPLFIPGSDGITADPTGSALIAWDGSYEASNAVKAAVGLLKIASEVRVVQVREEDKEDAFPSTKLLEYLSRHGIHADLQVEQPGGTDGQAIAEFLLAQARATNAGYMVMGGYNHSRIGQYLFGGVTRTLLADCPLPLLIAH
jgi:nucleotide-binding universal stress UspA family protein